MKKKDIQKLDDAMLENIEVPDSVLDMAREEMKRQQNTEVSQSGSARIKSPRTGKKIGGAIAVNRRVIVCAACAVLAVCVIVLCAVFVIKNNVSFNNSSGSYYDLSLLTKSDVTSVSDYNEQNGTSYICYDGATSAVLYSNNNIPVLFVENFTYGETTCTWYVVVNGDDYLDILENFGENLTSKTEINGYTIYYNSTDSCQYAEFYFGESRYCLSAESGSTRTAFEIIEYILG